MSITVVRLSKENLKENINTTSYESTTGVFARLTLLIIADSIFHSSHPKSLHGKHFGTDYQLVLYHGQSRSFFELINRTKNERNEGVEIMRERNLK